MNAVVQFLVAARDGLCGSMTLRSFDLTQFYGNHHRQDNHNDDDEEDGTAEMLEDDDEHDEEEKEWSLQEGNEGMLMAAVLQEFWSSSTRPVSPPAIPRIIRVNTSRSFQTQSVLTEHHDHDARPRRSSPREGRGRHEGVVKDNTALPQTQKHPTATPLERARLDRTRPPWMAASRRMTDSEPQAGQQHLQMVLLHRRQKQQLGYHYGAGGSMETRDDAVFGLEDSQLVMMEESETDGESDLQQLMHTTSTHMYMNAAFERSGTCAVLADKKKTTSAPGIGRPSGWTSTSCERPSSVCTGSDWMEESTFSSLMGPPHFAFHSKKPRQHASYAPRHVRCGVAYHSSEQHMILMPEMDTASI